MKIKLLCIFQIIFSIHFFYGQDIPNVAVYNLDGEKINISQIDSSAPVVMIFWATWCLPCMEELTNINEHYESWQQQAEFKIYAVSTDDARTASKVKTVATSRSWPYIVLLDPNQALKRALNINSIPYLVLLHKGKIVYSHIGYSAGDEDELIAKIKDCNSKTE